MKKISLLISFTLVSLTISLSQDSINIISTIDIETKGSGILISATEAHQPIDCFSCVFEQINDNPINHFAIYSGITHRLSVNQKFELETGIFMEERSFSGGSNTVDNWAFFPKIFLSGEDTINIFNREFNYKLNGGDYWNHDFNDILRIHSIDYQGLNGELGYKGYSLGFLIVGDLSKNIGLGLHQLHQLYVKKTFQKVHTSLYFSENYLLTSENHTAPKDHNVGIHLKMKISKSINLQSQFELRINEELGNSIAAGIGISGQINSLKLSSKLKYYQSEFNLGYRTDRNEYRGEGSYVGEQLYPLKNFYRNYSQWANYTKVQGRDLIGVELNLNWEKRIHNKIFFFTDIDLNIIGNPQTQTGSTIPLYMTGLKVQYFDFLKTEFYFTNKFMNLDTFYQTFQASKRPYFGGSVILDLKGKGAFQNTKIDKKKFD